MEDFPFITAASHTPRLDFEISKDFFNLADFKSGNGMAPNSSFSFPFTIMMDSLVGPRSPLPFPLLPISCHRRRNFNEAIHWQERKN
jgi:hypothetical protein